MPLQPGRLHSPGGLVRLQGRLSGAGPVIVSALAGNDVTAAARALFDVATQKMQGAFGNAAVIARPDVGAPILLFLAIGDPVVRPRIDVVGLHGLCVPKIPLPGFVSHSSLAIMLRQTLIFPTRLASFDLRFARAAKLRFDLFHSTVSTTTDLDGKVAVNPAGVVLNAEKSAGFTDSG